uniref:Uncharacterized protein n=1 Tax=Rhizophora mucronata TaxID=61149 RepID=A0A2P2NV53_RHIMU
MRGIEYLSRCSWELSLSLFFLLVYHAV